MIGANVTGIIAGTGAPLFSTAQKTTPTPVALINFAPLGTQANAYTLKVKFTTEDGTTFDQSFNIGANTSVVDVTTLVMAAIPKAQKIDAPPGAIDPSPTYTAGWYIAANPAGTGFLVYTSRALTEKTWNPKPPSPYKSATVSAVGATSQPTVSETAK